MTDNTKYPKTKDGLPYIGDLDDENANWLRTMQKQREANQAETDDPAQLARDHAKGVTEGQQD